MDRLNSVKPKDRTSAAWANEVIAELRRLNIIPGNGIRKTVTSKGTRIDLDLSDESDSTSISTDTCFPVYILEYTTGQLFKGATYRIVGKEYSGSGGEAEPIYFPHVTPSSKVPIGSTVLAHRIESASIQSSSD